MMKVAMVNHGTASEWGGGDSVQIMETAKRLIQRGHQVSIENSDKPNTSNADIVHIFNCRVHKSFISQVSTCQTKGVPIVVSPIWITLGKAIWGSRGTHGVIEKGIREGENAIEKELEKLKTRELIVELQNGNLDACGKGTFDDKWIDEIGKVLTTVDGVLTNSWLELKSVQSDLRYCGQTYGVANYGVDPKTFLDADPGPFRDYTGIKGPFVMQAGRIEPGKNQAMICWALRKINLPIVLIGGSKHWPAYSELCKEISGDKLKIIDHLPKELLASAYAAAKVHTLISWMDTCGLVSLEAALNSTPIIGSTFGHELEYLKNDAWLSDPGDEVNIRENIMKAWEEGEKSRKTKKLKERVLSEYNWEKTASLTENFYKEVIENV